MAKAQEEIKGVKKNQDELMKKQDEQKKEIQESREEMRKNQLKMMDKLEQIASRGLIKAQDWHA